MPAYPLDDQALLKVDRAHKGFEAASQSYLEEYEQVMTSLANKHNPFIYAAQSVLYEAMSNAAMAGFTRAQMEQVMECDEH